MNSNKPFLSIFFIVLYCFLSSGWAIAKGRLGLLDAINMALHENPELKAVISELKAKDAQRLRARSAFFPRFDVEQGFIRSDNPVMVFMEKLNQERFAQEDFRISNLNDPAPRSDWGTKFILTQPIFNGGREYIGNALAKKAVEITNLKKEAIEERVVFSVERAYIAALVKKKRREVVERALNTAEKGLELARSRYLAGTALKSDVLAAEARLLRLRQELAMARAEERTAMDQLNSIMARPQGETWILDEEAMGLGKDLRPVDHWISEAKRHRPELKIARELVEVAKIERKGARLRFLPSINLQGNYELHGEDPFSGDGESWAIMAKASFNIFNGLGDKARLMEATSELERAKAQRTKAEINTELEIRSAYNAYLAAKEAIDAAVKEVARAREALRLLRKRYAQGLALMVEVLGAEDAVKLAELGLEQARFETKVQELRLKLYAGTILERTQTE